MSCENLQFNLSLYPDGGLTDEEQSALDRHLTQCPPCRHRLAELLGTRNRLRALSRPEMPKDTLFSIRREVAQKLQVTETAPVFVFADNYRSRLRSFLMPSTVGTIASFIIGFAMLWGLTAGNVPRQDFTRYNTSPDPVFLLSGDDRAKLPPIPISDASPSVNPSGALVALTKSFVGDKGINDEVVVVADVFGNGLAHIAEVVEPRRNRQAVVELKKALETDPAYAPFVSAQADRRSQTVRVVLKIQRVDVVTAAPRQ